MVWSVGFEPTSICDYVIDAFPFLAYGTSGSFAEVLLTTTLIIYILAFYLSRLYNKLNSVLRTGVTMTKISVLDLDVVYLSYDEPNADANYENLLKKIPWAKRIHGVKGSDSAHKACASIAETDRFITIDGDNIVNEDFLHQHIEYDDDENISNTVFSWCGKNIINGLIYGNGGIKCWPKDLVLNMKTHENADKDDVQSQVDFCWKLNYQQQNSVMSTVFNNATSKQAWRAGFREGVKMCLDQGEKMTAEKLLNSHWKNLHRLYVWMMVGRDVKNGDWAIYGARQGLWMMLSTNWDFKKVRDFDELDKIFDKEQKKTLDLSLQIKSLGFDLKDEIPKLPIDVKPLAPCQSTFFKTVYLNPSRTADQTYII